MSWIILKLLIYITENELSPQIKKLYLFIYLK